MPPEISVADYLERIRRYASCSNECFVLSLVYIDRLILHNNFALTTYNVHRVVITR
jgi:Cyclin